MSLSNLKELVAPPTQPIEAGSLNQWNTVEERLGLSLPSDYRDFILAYGTGQFARFYLVFNPFSISEWVNLFTCVKRLCNAESEIKRHWPDTVPYRIYPERPGLLPWGCDENGNYYFWLTAGPADTWQVISDEVRGEGFREYGRCMTDFLHDVLSGKTKALAGDFPQDDDRIFEPLDVTKEPKDR